MSTMLQKVNGLGAAHKIPEWLSFRKEFVPSSSFFSLYLFTWYRNDILFPYKSSQNEFIPVFIPNETPILVRNFSLCSG